MVAHTTLLLVLALLPLICISAIYPVQPPTCTGDDVLKNAEVIDGYCPRIWAEGLSKPRGIAVASNSDILVVEANINQITVLWDANGDGKSDSNERSKLASANGLNHAVYIHDAFVYASSPTTVYRWPYKAGDRHDLGTPTTVVVNIPCCHHATRTIEFDNQGRMLVTVGSASNVDKNTTHTHINRFTLPSTIPAGGIEWHSGTVYAYGLRNEVGIRFDLNDPPRLWGVENGVDMLYRDDLGGDIHDDNPAEELNLFDKPLGSFYGYPYCWSVFDLKGFMPGTQMAQPDFMDKIDDAWCQNETRVVKPNFTFQAHMAPLDIIFWRSNTSFGGNLRGHAFVAFHGSWNRRPAVGYRVSLVSFNEYGNAVQVQPFLSRQGNADGIGWIRPVALGEYSCASTSSGKECLMVSSDRSGHLISVSYDK